MKTIRAKVEVLSQDEIQAIHKSTLKILENTGIKIPNAECLEMCAKIGARVDKDSQVVKIPAVLMEELLARVKAEELNKKPNENKEDKIEKLTGGISTQIFIVDYKTCIRRYGLLDDVMKGIALIDHLDNIPASSSVVIPSDVPYNMTDVVSHQMIYGYSKKPGGTYILSPASAKYILQMAKVIGRNVSYLLETVSPLQFRKESLEMALVFAEMGQPLHMGPMVIGGATGPVTLAGTITLQNTEILASMLIIYALTDKFTRYGGACHTMDLRTMLCSFGSPNQALLGMASVQMARFYGYKTGSNSGLTDSLIPDFQGGFEKAANAIFSCLAGATNVGCQGIVGADQGISMEQMVIDNEWLDEYNYILNGIEVNEDTIAADLIESVGIGGNYISEEHTAMYMRDNYWNSRLFNRDSWDSWQTGGSRDLLDKAHEFVESVVGDYKNPEPAIDRSKFDEIDYIVKCADKELARERQA